MSQLAVPNETLKYILFQRTEYLCFPNSFTYRVVNKILPFSIYKRVVAIEAKIAPNRIKTLYERDMTKEYLSIKDYLPEPCASILDIGCGIGGIDVFISKHYGDKHSILYLLDKTSIEDDIDYGFETKREFYNSLDLAKTMLMSNGIAEKYIYLIEATDQNEIPISDKVDLVISLISWGFHYPVETYLDKAYDVLVEGGSMIIDVRIGTNGIDLLNNIFRKVDVILEEKKFHRVLALK